MITITPLPPTQQANPSSTASITIDLGISPQTSLTGVGLRVFFDSTQITVDPTDTNPADGTPDAITNVFQPGPFTAFQVQADGSNLDGDATTDMFILAAWGLFNPAPTSGQDLFTVAFTTGAGFTGTHVNSDTSSTPPACTSGDQQTAQITAPPTPTPSNTPTVSPTPSDTPTPSNTPTPSDTPTPSNTPTASNTPTNTLTPSITPTASNTPSIVAPAIPTLSGRGLALMVLLMLGIAAVYLMRQRN